MKLPSPRPQAPGRHEHARDIAPRHAGEHGTRGRASVPLAGLVAVATMVVLELVRSSGPLLDRLFVSGGLEAAVTGALLTYLSPAVVVAVAVLLGLMVRRRRDLPVLVGVVVLLAVLRLAVQALDGEPRVLVGLAAVGVSIAVLVAAVGVLAARPGGGALAAGALAAGVAAGLALQLVLGTWDAYWRAGFVGWMVTGVLVAGLVALALWSARTSQAVVVRRPRRLWVLGPFLALSTMVIGSLPFVASQSGVPATVAGLVTTAGVLIAAELAMRRSAVRRTPPGVVQTVAAALALPALAFAVLRMPVAVPLHGLLVLVALLGCQLAAVLSLASALEPAPAGADSDLGTRRPVIGWGLSIAAGVAGLGAIVPMLLYQMDYDTPLGFPNYLALVGAAAVVGVGGVRRSGTSTAATRVGAGVRPVLATGAALVVLATVTAVVGSVTRPATLLDSARASASDRVRVLVWNLHYGVSEAGDLHLEAIARTVERYDADVVLLNEVSRGWIIGGAADMGTWLSDRLGGHYAFAPAADRQFGNAVLSRWPLREVRVHRLPYGHGPQYRSALSATVDTAAGDLAVVAVHLQQHRSSAPTRILQLQTLIPRLKAIDTDAMIVGGDFNAMPGEPEIQMMHKAGYVSAVDEVGDPAALTIPSSAPTARYDWLFGRGVRFTRATVLTEERASDHLPILATVVP